MVVVRRERGDPHDRVLLNPISILVSHIFLPSFSFKRDRRFLRRGPVPMPRYPRMLVRFHRVHARGSISVYVSYEILPTRVLIMRRLLQNTYIQYIYTQSYSTIFTSVHVLFSRSVRLGLGDRQRPASTQGRQHVASASENADSSADGGVYSSATEKQYRRRQSPAATVASAPPLDPAASAYEAAGERAHRPAAESRQQRRHRQVPWHVSRRQSRPRYLYNEVSAHCN